MVLTEEDAPWYFGDGVCPPGWVRQPVPIGAECVGGCGQAITLTDSGAFIFSPSTLARYPVHWPCLHDLAGAPVT